MTESILDKIKSYKLEEVAHGKEEISFEELATRAQDVSAPRGFANALRDARRAGYGLIAEVKKASPSKGLIRKNFDPVAIAEAYEAGGAACLSVLTDGPSFQGAPDYLTAAREAVNLPVLRKDFLYDPWQVAQSRALGADAILIILAAVTDEEAHALENAAIDFGMDVLAEVHNEEELHRAEALKTPLIGINNRDLNTFETSLDVTKKLARLVSPGRAIVAESGLSTPEDLAELAQYGARSFLIGESLMRHDDVAAATRKMLADPLMPGGI